ncbi:MAG: abortive infection family protein [Planctomycetaceae bacterium]
MSILKEITGNYERADSLVRMLISKATGGNFEEIAYFELRLFFIKDAELAQFVPNWLKSIRDGNQFWQFIKPKFPTYAERREFLWKEFQPLLRRCETGQSLPAEDEVITILKTLNSEGVESVWRKALFRLPEDPDGSITTSRTLIETVCKHILEEFKEPFDERDDLPKLYRKVALKLKLTPEDHDEQVFKQILGGCSSVVTGIGLVRNRLGDAHGHDRSHLKPKKRHAKLAVNLAGAMALFLLETHQKNKHGEGSSS